MSHRAPAKRFLDIEVALQWAYRDELPKRQHGGRFGIAAVTGMAMFRQVADDDGAGREPGFPAALGDPHPDSPIIEAAVRELAGWAGYRFDDDIIAGLSAGLPVTAETVEQAAMEAVAAMAGIVAVHARAGTRPRWSRERPEPFPERGPNGKPKVLIDETFVATIDRKGRVRYEPADHAQPDDISYVEPVPCPPVRKDRYREGAYCPLIYKPTPARLITERAEHAAWRVALDILHDGLSGRLTSIAPLPAAAPWRPWLDDADVHGPPPQLFAALRDAPHRRLTREQQAAHRRLAPRRAGRARPPDTPPASDNGKPPKRGRQPA